MELPIGYNLKKKKLGRIDILTTSEVLHDPACVFIDNSTLSTSTRFLKKSDEDRLENFWGIFEKDRGTDSVSMVNLIQNLVIYEKIVVDGFVLSNDPDSMSIAKIFPEIIKALYLSDAQLSEIGLLVETKISSLKTLSAQKPELEGPAKWSAKIDFEKDLYDQLSRGRIDVYEARRQSKEEEVFNISIPGWMARSDNHLPRTYFYSILSKSLGVPYAPHPYRCPLLRAFLEHQIDATRDVIFSFQDLLKGIGKELSNTFKGYDIQINIPPVAEYIIKTTETFSHLPERIMEVRNSIHATDFRNWCIELQTALSSGSSGLVKAKKLYTELEKARMTWSRDFDEGAKYRTRKLTISSVLKLLGIETDFQVKFPILWNKDFKHVLFLNDLVNE